MREFHIRLSRCVKRGDLTRSDLARWFDRPYSTIRDWLTNPRTPDGPAGRESWRLLDLLEKAIERDARFPVPPQLSGRYRAKYIKDLIRQHAKRDPDLPSSRTAA